MSASKEQGSSSLPAPIQLIVGLGNPGEEYARTRHNAGFYTIDILGERLGAGFWKQQCGAFVSTVKLSRSLCAGREVEPGENCELLLAKPQSFMNSSGGPVSKLCRKFALKPEEILIVHDELDIPAGDVRLKFGGGHAGHNGLRSIIDKLQSKNFARLRVGIGRPPGRMSVVDFVLQQLRASYLEDFEANCTVAADAAELCLGKGFLAARDAVNGLHRLSSEA